MRLALLVVLLLLVAIGGYAWKTNPDGCRKLGVDFVAVFQPQPASQDTTADSASNPPPVPKPAPPPPPVVKPSPLQTWHAPADLPTQPNWTWTTSDGTTYQNVTVTKIDPDIVSITHSLGVAHVPIANLPPDIQKQLNYDPAVAAAEKSENEREDAHPYYPFANIADAQTAARELNWPLAWVCSFTPDLTAPSPDQGSEADLTQMAMAYLKTRAVVIFLNGDDDLLKPQISPVVREQQFFQIDDGPLPGGHHFMGPKVVFTDPNITTPLGRVSYTEMHAAREAAIDAVLAPTKAAMAAPVPAATPAP
jgi:hypothetical protein